MARPQRPELRRSGTTPAHDPDNIGPRLEANPRPRSSGPEGPVPEANRPGHHPEHDQDKPDLDAFVERFRTVPAGEASGGERSDETGSPLHHTKRLVGIGGALAVAVAGLVIRRVKGRK